MSSTDLVIIIITYNSGKYIKKCIDSILSSITNLNIKITIIDNYSMDNTLNIINKYFGKRVQIIKNNNNIGFARGVNMGIRANTDKDILLINPDTICEKTSIQRLINEKEKYKADICGGKMYINKRENHKTIVREPNLMIGLFDLTNLKKIYPNNYWHKYFYYLDSKIDAKKAKKVDVVSGGYMYIGNKVLNNIGLLDEKYFMYLEDIDYCIRAKKKGFKTYYFPSSKIWHKGGGSSNNEDKINYSAWIKSRSYYFQKNSNILSNIIIQPIFVLDRLLVGIIRKIKSKQ